MLAAWSNTKYTVVLQCFLYTHSIKFTGTIEAYKEVWHELLKVCASNWRASLVSWSPHTTLGRRRSVFPISFSPGQFRIINLIWYAKSGLPSWMCRAFFFKLHSVLLLFSPSHPWILSFSPYELCIKSKLQLADENL